MNIADIDALALLVRLLLHRLAHAACALHAMCNVQCANMNKRVFFLNGDRYIPILVAKKIL